MYDSALIVFNASRKQQPKAPVWVSLKFNAAPNQMRKIFRRACARHRALVYFMPRTFWFNFMAQLRGFRDMGEMDSGTPEPNGKPDWEYVLTHYPLREGYPIIAINGETMPFHKWIGMPRQKPNLVKRAPLAHGPVKPHRGRPTELSRKLKKQKLYSPIPEFVPKGGLPVDPPRVRKIKLKTAR